MSLHATGVRNAVQAHFGVELDASESCCEYLHCARWKGGASGLSKSAVNQKDITNLSVSYHSTYT